MISNFYMQNMLYTLENMAAFYVTPKQVFQLLYFVIME